MKRAALLLLALVACDDESLPARVAAAQINGFADAQAHCDVTVVTSCQPTHYLGVECTKFIDGSALVSIFGVNTGIATRFYARSDARSADCSTAWKYDQNMPDIESVTLSGGDLTFLSEDDSCNLGTPPAPTVLDIQTVCTGFNLEAFGVE